jgi:hypothetical protein
MSVKAIANKTNAVSFKPAPTQKPKIETQKPKAVVNSQYAVSNLNTQGSLKKIQLDTKLDSKNVTKITGGNTDSRIASAKQTNNSIDLKKRVTNQAQFERDNNYNRTVGKRINPTQAGNSVPNGTYTQTNIPQKLQVPTVRNADILSVTPLTQREKDDIKNHSANINRLNKSIDAELKNNRAPVTIGDDGGPNYAYIKSLQNQVSDLEGRRERLWNRERLSSSAANNGKVFTATADNANKNATPVIFVNGINTDQGRSGTEALELSKRFKVPVQQVVNVNEMDRARLISTSSLSNLGNLRNTEGTTAGLGRSILINPKAATTTANAILDQLDNPKLKDQPIKIVAYSQGGAITAQALKDVNGVINNREQGDKMINRIKILGLAPAAVQRDIPQNMRGNYRIIYDRNDPVAQARGVDKSNNILDLKSIQDRESRDPNFFGPHLSYFKHYEGTDPGSRFNTQADIQMQKWFSGTSGSRSGAVQIDMNDSNFTREVTPKL